MGLHNRCLHGAPIDEGTALRNRFDYHLKFDYLDALLFGVTIAFLSPKLSHKLTPSDLNFY